MNILFYYPSNKRTVSLETIMVLLQNCGHQVHLVTLAERGELHDFLEAHGINAVQHVVKSQPRALYFLTHAKYLVSYCKRNNIDKVFSHLQEANIIGVFTQFFCKSKYVIFRHHFKFHQELNDPLLIVNRNEIIADRIINKLADKIVVPSKGVYDGILKHEKVRQEKLEIIPYIYNFLNYHTISEKRVRQIKESFKSKLLIIMVARLTPFKRHILAFRTFNKLIKQGYDIKVLVLDEGEEKENLQTYVTENTLQESIYFLGYQKNILEYLAAGDLLVHPSVTEASNSVVKEAGLVGTPVVVCKGVGDFDDYIMDGINSFAISKEHVEEELFQVLEKIYCKADLLNNFAELLKEKVMLKFGENKMMVLSAYQKLLIGR